MYDTPRHEQSNVKPAYFMSTLLISPPRSRPLARCELIYIRNQVCFHRLRSVSVQTAQARRSKLANTHTFPGSGAKLDLQLPNLHKWAVSFASPWLSLMIFLMEHSVIRRTRFQFQTYWPNRFIIKTYAKNVLASCFNGHAKFPKFPRLMEGPDQRIPTKLIA